jgi:ribose transport system substrate-binding protein
MERVKSRRKVPLIAIVAVLATALSATSATARPSESSGASGSANKSIAVVFPNSSNPIVQIVLDGAKEQAKKRGYKLYINDPGNDLNKQVSAVESFIQRKVGAIVSVVPEPKVFEKIAAKARRNGVVWVTYADTLENEDATLTWRHYEGGYGLGKEAARWINETLGGQAKVAILTFEQGAWARYRRRGMEAALAKLAPNAVIVAKQDGGLAAPDGSKVIDSVLQANPDLNVVLSIADTGSEGAYQALLNAGRAKDDPKTFVGGLDGSERAYELILENTFYRATDALRLSDIGRAMIDGPANIIATGKKRDIIVPYTLLTRSTPGKIRLYLQDWK